MPVIGAQQAEHVAVQGTTSAFSEIRSRSVCRGVAEKRGTSGTELRCSPLNDPSRVGAAETAASSSGNGISQPEYKWHVVTSSVNVRREVGASGVSSDFLRLPAHPKATSHDGIPC